MPRAVLDSTGQGSNWVIYFLCLFLCNEQTFPRSSIRDFPSHLIAQTWLPYAFLHLPLGCGMEVPRPTGVANHLREWMLLGPHDHQST